LSGPELVRKIKDTYTHIPLVVLTGSEELTDKKRNELADCGAIFMFVKPFTSNNLKNLQNMLDVTGAAWSKGKKIRPSWYTSAAGIVVILAGVMSFLDKHDPIAVGVIAAGIGLLKAQDASAMKELVENLGKKKEH
jgi:CheY-like chemotaxis protein